MTDIRQLDLTGVVLPFCLLDFKNALTRLRDGQLLEVRLRDPDVAADLVRLIDRSGDRLVEQGRIGDRLRMLVERSGKQQQSIKEDA
jgi:TusA-related sulfurtransferase